MTALTRRLLSVRCRRLMAFGALITLLSAAVGAEPLTKLFELWKIGEESKDNGLLLLWSTGDRRV